MYEKFFSAAKFVRSAPKTSFLPADCGYEVAFLGRSNAGKSSAINAVTQQNSLARTSKTPGRTGALNIFEFDDERRLVDVPGFGYAKVSIGVKDSWRKLINDYLLHRSCLQGVVVVMDIRHPCNDMEMNLLTWLSKAELNTHVILTKADKLGRSAKQQTLKKVALELAAWPNITLSLFSSKDKEGLDNLRARLLGWYKVESSGNNTL
jgi:GTP-binding protein